MLYRVHLTWFVLTTLVVIGIDCTGTIRLQLWRSPPIRNNIISYCNKYDYISEPEYSDILYNTTHFPGPLVCRIRQVPLYIVHLTLPHNNIWLIQTKIVGLFGFHTTSGFQFHWGQNKNTKNCLLVLKNLNLTVLLVWVFRCFYKKYISFFFSKILHPIFSSDWLMVLRT